MEEFFIFLLIMLGAALVIYVDYLIAKAFSDVAETKGFYETKYFWFCFILGAVGYLLVIALPDKKNAASIKSVDELPEL